MPKARRRKGARTVVPTMGQPRRFPALYRGIDWRRTQAMRPAVPFRFAQTQQDLDTLRQLLGVGLQVARWSPPAQPRILSLACGFADETGVLVETLAPAAAPCFFFGYDLRPGPIETARRRWLPAAAAGQELEFRAGNATHLDRLTALPTFDFIMIRHQNFWHSPEDWLEIFRHALNGLRASGCLAITSYFDREHALATASLRQLEAEPVAQLVNPHSRTLGDAPGKSVDRHLALFRHSP